MSESYTEESLKRQVANLEEIIQKGDEYRQAIHKARIQEKQRFDRVVHTEPCLFKEARDASEEKEYVEEAVAKYGPAGQWLRQRIQDALWEKPFPNF